MEGDRRTRTEIMNRSGKIGKGKESEGGGDRGNGKEGEGMTEEKGEIKTER